MLSCKDISKLASDHIDNNLPPLMKMKVKMHLFMCHKCRDFINQMRLTVNTLKNLTPAPPEESFINKQANDLMEIAKNLNSNGSGNKKL